MNTDKRDLTNHRRMESGTCPRNWALSPRDYDRKGQYGWAGSVARPLRASSSGIGALRPTISRLPVRVFGGDLVGNIHSLISCLVKHASSDSFPLVRLDVVGLVGWG